MSSKNIKPIAIIKSDFKEKFGIPRQSGRINNISNVEFLPPYNDKNAFRELKKFSHVWLIFGFSEVPEKEFTPLIRPPRLGGNKKVGVFASRSPFRPNGLGLSSVEIVDIIYSEKNVSIKVKGADLLDGTPIYDVKPYIKKYDSHENATDGYLSEYIDKKLNVIFEVSPENFFDKESLIALKECLSEDPRPAYQNDGRIYGFKFSDCEIKFSVSGDDLTVLDIEKV
ncbi:MAG: tRNA (N6-threonylcarbamoyladenosine(37)-N6)-methyltransferase TrmO [Clostridia bacterium]|nr:tRNA (N6-threonylcarbamoyladenosine(37)-N6)-methyltransferase TrmO [Clostridia bacterium]